MEGAGHEQRGKGAFGAMLRRILLMTGWWVSTMGVSGILGVPVTGTSRLPLDEPCTAEDSDPRGTVVGGLALPDLRTLPPSDLRLSVHSTGRVLRFANMVWNRGPWPLELRGELEAASGLIDVYQTVCAVDGIKREQLVGTFVWHVHHGHWHLGSFARYQLWSLKPDGRPDEVVAEGEKISYCLRDTDTVDASRPGFPISEVYQSCGPRRQGLSVGWGDLYRSFLEGQSLDLGGLPDGTYALTSTANPERILLESDYGNNEATIYLRIAGGELEIVPFHDLSKEICLSEGYC
jgi:hypothetical protein